MKNLFRVTALVIGLLALSSLAIGYHAQAAEADLELTITHDSNPGLAGGPITIIVTMKNLGPDPVPAAYDVPGGASWDGYYAGIELFGPLKNVTYEGIARDDWECFGSYVGTNVISIGCSLWEGLDVGDSASFQVVSEIDPELAIQLGNIAHFGGDAWFGDDYMTAITDPNGSNSSNVNGSIDLYPFFCGQPIEDFDNIIHGTPTNDYLVGTDMKDLIFGYDGNDVIIGEAGNDCIYAGYGDDFISGRGGDDTIFCGDGDDFARGNNGNDELNGEAGKDRLSPTNRRNKVRLECGDFISPMIMSY
jgi:Ca2+-binding RTX toxin-like protein